jgi:DNA-binding CsgD family transcriptional regulator
MSPASSTGATSSQIEAVRHLFALLRLPGPEEDPQVRSRLVELAEELRGAVSVDRRSVQDARRAVAGMTARETDIVALAALGYKNAEIAGLSALSPETVKSYLRNAMDKFGVHSRQAVVEAARHAGVIP